MRSGIDKYTRPALVLSTVTLLAALAGCEPILPSVLGDKDLIDPLFEATAGPRTIALGDINRDGLTDVVSVSSESQPVQIHLRDPLTGRFVMYTIAGGAPIAQATDIELADMNGDNRLDIVVLVNDTGFIAPAGASKPGTFVILLQGSDPTNPNDWIQIPSAGRPPPVNLNLPGNGKGLTDLVVGELDGLNGPDIVVLSNESDATRVRLFLNPGPSLVANQDVWSSTTIEQDASDMAQAHLADLDQDGDLDVIMSVPAAKSFNIRWLQNPLFGNSSAEASPVPKYKTDEVDPLFEVTAGAAAVVIGDIDDDGVLDAASISAESQPVQIHLRSSATGKFETITIAGGGPLARMNDIDLVDLNGDGKLDIVVLVNDTGFAPTKRPQRCHAGLLDPTKQGALVALIQGADPTVPSNWTQVDIAKFDTNETGVTDMAVADYTNDGHPDVAVISNEPQEDDCVHKFVYLLTNPGPAGVTDAAQWTQSLIEQNIVDMSRIEAADLDRDGDMDVIFTSPTAKTFNIAWGRNTSNGATWTTVFLAQQEGGGEYLKIGDIDRDGNLDVAAASVKDSLVQWFRNPGPVALAPTAIQLPWAVYNIGSVDGTINQIALADLDNNGTLDAFATASGAAVGFLRGVDVTQPWNKFAIFSTDPSPATTIGRVAFSDIDGNSMLDFIAPYDRVGISSDRFVSYLSFAETGSRWVRRLIGQQQNGGDYIAVGDIDGDSLLDVAASSTSLGITQWFRNPGRTALAASAAQVPWPVFNIGQFAEQVTINGNDAAKIEINQVQLVDLNADGQLDCFVTGSGTAFGFTRGLDVYAAWSATALFTTNPLGTIGRVRFIDLYGNGTINYLAPIDRPGLLSDQLVIFPAR